MTTRQWIIWSAALSLNWSIGIIGVLRGAALHPGGMAMKWLIIPYVDIAFSL
jgi:hypothetical protein